MRIAIRHAAKVIASMSTSRFFSSTATEGFFISEGPRAKHIHVVRNENSQPSAVAMGEGPAMDNCNKVENIRFSGIFRRFREAMDLMVFEP